jgi:hypothetical protein
MWKSHFISLCHRAWANLLAALSSSTLSIVVFSIVLPVAIFLLLMCNQWVTSPKQNRTIVGLFKTKATPAFIITIATTTLVWVCLFAWSVANTIYTDHENLVREVAEQASQRKTQCWSQNITLPAPRNQPLSVKSASEVVVFCNQERKAPLVVVVTYDKAPILAGPIAFAEGRILKTVEEFRDNQVFFSLESPSIKPYQIFIVTVYGSSDEPPMSKDVRITETNPEQ